MINWQIFLLKKMAIIETQEPGAFAKKQLCEEGSCKKALLKRHRKIIMQAIILAGTGLGLRLRPLKDHTQKHC
nr:hypothetical protein [Candidatus Brachybacter algidus]